MVFKLPSEMTLSHAAEIRTLLLSVLASHEPIEIDARAVTEVDIAGLQLLCSLHRSASRQKTTVSFTGGTRGALIEEIEHRAGFARHIGCADGCLWQEKKRA